MNPKIVMMVPKQMQECSRKSPDGTHWWIKIGIKMIINEADITDIQAEIEGPIGTPYEGGLFRCKLAIEQDFPNNPPKGTLSPIQAISSQRSSIPTYPKKDKYASIPSKKIGIQPPGHSITSFKWSSASLSSLSPRVHSTNKQARCSWTTTNSISSMQSWSTTCMLLLSNWRFYKTTQTSKKCRNKNLRRWATWLLTNKTRTERNGWKEYEWSETILFHYHY